jgi:hypothetical protein
MMGDRFSHSSAPVRRVKAIQFGILDPDFIVRCYLPGRMLPLLVRALRVVMA